MAGCSSASKIGAGKGYSPCHITGFFTIHMNPDPMLSGSTGAGVCLQEGVVCMVTVEEGERSLDFISNGELGPMPPTCQSLFRAMAPALKPMRMTIRLKSVLPANVGYGVSGASALSMGFALNEALDLGFAAERVAQMAHVAEIENITGLGDVSAEFTGGFEVRLKAGAPGIGEIVSLPFPRGYAVVSSPLLSFPTSRMITAPAYAERINALGDTAMEHFMEAPTVENFMRQSRTFWDGVGIADDRMREVIRLFEGAGIAYPSVKKGLVFGIVVRDALPRVVRRLVPSAVVPEGEVPYLIAAPKLGLKLIISDISQGGAC